jgi:8-amino-7-oxononanoate synthase
LTACGWHGLLLPSITPIQALILGSNRRVAEAGQQLARAGCWVGVIRPPTVPEGTARLRIALSALHTEDQVDALVAALDALLTQWMPEDRFNPAGGIAC